jgi:hypothetical protein
MPKEEFVNKYTDRLVKRLGIPRDMARTMGLCAWEWQRDKGTPEELADASAIRWIAAARDLVAL